MRRATDKARPLDAALADALFDPDWWADAIANRAQEGINADKTVAETVAMILARRLDAAPRLLVKPAPAETLDVERWAEVLHARHRIRGSSASAMECCGGQARKDAREYAALASDPHADDTEVCVTCAHGRASHSSGGMCDGDGSECYCVRFPDAPDFASDARLADDTEGGTAG